MVMASIGLLAHFCGKITHLVTLPDHQANKLKFESFEFIDAVTLNHSCNASTTRSTKHTAHALTITQTIAYLCKTQYK